jgi:hypothetical protein
MAMVNLPLSISLLYDHRTKRNIKKNEQTTTEPTFGSI